MSYLTRKVAKRANSIKIQNKHIIFEIFFYVDIRDEAKAYLWGIMRKYRALLIHNLRIFDNIVSKTWMSIEMAKT